VFFSGNRPRAGLWGFLCGWWRLLGRRRVLAASGEQVGIG